MTTHTAVLEQLLSEPVERVRAHEQVLFHELLAKNNNRLVLFGAGGAGRAALKNLRSEGVVPLAFADNDPRRWGTSVEGVPVLKPEEAARQFGSSTLFLVTIYSQGHVFAKTLQQLKAIGVREVASDATLRWSFPNTLPFFCHDLPHKVFEARERILAAAALWSEDWSLREFLNQVRWRALGDLGALELPTPEESYFPNFVALGPEETFVDCGAYTGDTVQRVVELTGGKFRKILAIEADAHTFSELTKWIASLPQETQERIVPFPIAVGASRCVVTFSAQDLTVRDGESSTVECYPLDELLQHEHPTFIKMDIEGAELDALEGARDNIRRHRPVLAICAYHRQGDLWEIPLKIAEITDGYEYFLRAHEGDGWQTVVYAIPPERIRR